VCIDFQLYVYLRKKLFDKWLAFECYVTGKNMMLEPNTSHFGTNIVEIYIELDIFISIY